MPMAAVVLKDGLAFCMITIDFAAKNGPLTPVATSLVVDVNAPLLCLVLQPANCLDTETAFGVKGLFKSRLWREDPITGAVELGFPVRTSLGVAR